MNESWRLFLAIELNDPLRAELARLQSVLNSILRNHAVRWVDPRNIHLTLKFLGNVDKERVPALSAAMERAASKVAPHNLTAGGIGAFPSVSHPNNIWVGLDGDVAQTALLARRIEDECALAGFARDERGFTPHLTLGRIDKKAAISERAAVSNMIQTLQPAVYGEILVDTVLLVSSDLKPTGPVYKTRAEFPLRA